MNVSEPRYIKTDEISFAVFGCLLIIAILGICEYVYSKYYTLNFWSGITNVNIDVFVCLFLCSAGLMFSERKGKPFFKGASFFLGLFAAILSGGLFVQSIYSIEIVGNNLPDRGSALPDTDNIYRLTNTFFCLFLVGGALTVRNFTDRSAILIHQWFLHIVSLCSVIAILANWSKIPSDGGWGAIIYMPFSSSVCLFVLSLVAILKFKSFGITAAFTGDRIGNVVARKVFFRLAVAISVLGFIRMLSNSIGLLDVNFGISLLCLSFLLVSLFVLTRSSYFINRLDDKANGFEQTLNRNINYLDATPDALVIVDEHHIIRLVNKKCEELFTYEKAKLVGSPVSKILFDSSGDWIKEYSVYFGPMGEAMLHREHEIVARKNNGEEFPVEVTQNIARFSNGNFIAISIRDITEKKALQSNLDDISERLSLATENTGIAIWDFDLKDNTILFNKVLWRLYGLSHNYSNKVDYSTWIKMVYHDDRQRILDAINTAIEDTGFVEDIYRVVWSDTSIHYIKIKAVVSYNEDKVAGKLLGTCWDYTNEKLAQDAMQLSLRQNLIFINQAPSAIAMFDNDMRYLAASQKWIDDYHLDTQDIIGKSHYEVFPEIGDEWKEIHRRCLNGAIDTCAEAYFERNDGRQQWLSWDVRPWYTPEQSIGGIIMNTNDITPLKQSINERLKVEEILDKSNETARIGSWEVDLVKGKVVWSRVTRLIHEVEEDYVPDLMAGIEFYKPGYSRESIQAAINESINTGKEWDLELELITFKKRTVWVRAIGFAEFKKGKCIRLYGIFQDINSTKNYQSQIQKKNAELDAILNAGYVSLIGSDVDGLITHFSKGAEKLLQYTADEMIGKKTPIIIHKIDEVKKRGEELSKTLGRTIEGFDTFVVIPREFGEYDANEWTYVRKDGSEFPVQLVVTALKDGKGAVDGFLGIAIDITEIKKARDNVKSLLGITTDQNDRLKNFAHIVSHNLRAHASNFSMLLNLLEDDQPGLADNEMIQLMKIASDNLKETVDHLSDVVHLNVSAAENMKAINLQKVIESSVNNVAIIAREANVAIYNNIPEGIYIWGIEAYTDSVFLNFITNSIKYRSINENAFVKIDAFVEDEFIGISIEDNGLGIDLKENRSKLFGMYKTFHGNKDARGIGLFITRNQIDAMGGKVDVESEVGKGTIFTIYLKKYEKNTVSMHY